MILDGIRLDVIQDLHHISRDTNGLPITTDIFAAALLGSKSDKYFNGEFKFNALWRTLITNQDVFHDGAKRLGSESLDAHRRAFEYLMRRTSWSRKMIDMLKGRKFRHELQGNIHKMLQLIEFRSAGFYYGVTRNGYMAMVPDSTQKGDILCVLYQGRAPFVLRLSPAQDENTFLFIGPAYVHGFMDGEAVTWLEEGKLQESTFILI